MKVKYPRTYHLPFSLGSTSDDKVLKDTSLFNGKQVVITEKMDGENTTIYSDAFHARSLDSRHHSSRDWIAKLQGEIGYKIPTGWRVCGENLYAKHSLAYDNLPSYFMAFSVWDENNNCLDWDFTKEFLSELGLVHPKVLFEGEYSDNLVKDLVKTLDLEKQEGFVVRLRESFAYNDFTKSVAKFVRQGHVQTEDHWMHQEVVPNLLASNGIKPPRGI